MLGSEYNGSGIVKGADHILAVMDELKIRDKVDSIVMVGDGPEDSVLAGRFGIFFIGVIAGGVLGIILHGYLTRMLFAN